MAVQDEGEGGNLLDSPSEGEGGENRGKRKRFVFKWGLEVGEIDRLCLHTTEKEGDGEVCLTETGQGKEKQFIFMLL